MVSAAAVLTAAIVLGAMEDSCPRYLNSRDDTVYGRCNDCHKRSVGTASGRPYFYRSAALQEIDSVVVLYNFVSIEDDPRIFLQRGEVLGYGVPYGLITRFNCRQRVIDTLPPPGVHVIGDTVRVVAIDGGTPCDWRYGLQFRQDTICLPRSVEKGRCVKQPPDRYALDAVITGLRWGRYWVVLPGGRGEAVRVEVPGRRQATK